LTCTGANENVKHSLTVFPPSRFTKLITILLCIILHLEFQKFQLGNNLYWQLGESQAHGQFIHYFTYLCRDVLYLDLALDGAVRSAVESSLTQIRGPASSKADTDEGEEEEKAQTSTLIDLITICAESVCLSAGSNLELSMVHKDYQVSSIE